MATGSWKERYERLTKRLRSAGERATEVASQARNDVETIGAAAAFGAVRGDFEGGGKRFEIGGDPDKGTKGVSPELVIGAPLKLIAYYMGRKEGASDVGAVANGALASWAFEASRVAARKRAQGTAPPGTGGPRAGHAPRLEAVRQRIHAAEAARKAASAAK